MSRNDFFSLPSQFVFKTNNGSARNIIVANKDTLDVESTAHQLKVWLKTNHYYVGFETQYRDIIPKAKQYIDQGKG